MSERETKETLHGREKRLAKKLEISATTARAACQILDIPEEVYGLTILDLAAGASSLAAELIKRGSNVHALDYRYNLKDSQLSHQIETSFRKVIQQTPQKHRHHMSSVTQEAIEQFKKSFRDNPGNYHYGYLTALPFPDEFADFTFSLNGMADLVEDFDVMRQAVVEALRVTKPGGTIVIAPFLTKHGVRYPLYADTHPRLVSQLNRERVGIVLIESDIPTYRDSRLRIIKTGVKH